MARRPIPMIELDEVFYRFQQGHALSRIARCVGQSRATVRKYVRLAVLAGLSRGGDDEQRRSCLEAVRELLATAGGPCGALAQQLLAPHLEQIKVWLTEPDMTMKQVWRLLKERGVHTSYCSVKRFIRHHLRPVCPRVTVRLETPPGGQAQVDFGRVNVVFADGGHRRLWAFLMTLSYSRHRFLRFVQRQDVPSWIDCHVRAFEFFGGVPRTVLLDNLKAGVVRPDLYEPTLNRAYADLERHYGFAVDPTPVATPQHKGKVERGVPVVRQQLIAGRVFQDLADLNDRALLWCRDGVGRDLHGTTQEAPMVRFDRDEKAVLVPLPESPFDPPTWAQCKVHPDHHIVFGRSYYSLPTRFVGKTVWVRATRRLVEVFCEECLVKTHTRACRPGTWVTDPSDYPEQAKAFLLADPAHCRHKAQELGTHVVRMMEHILSNDALRNLRKAQAVLRLGDKYGPHRLDQACGHLLAFECTDIKRLQRILHHGLPLAAESTEPTSVAPPCLDFLHPPQSFAAQEVCA